MWGFIACKDRNVTPKIAERHPGAGSIPTVVSGRPDPSHISTSFVEGYGFIKIHSTLRMTPAMAAGVTAKLWDVADLVDLLIESESKKAA
ncbi:MAG TPA: hypothetical protein VF424_07065 [Vicinamibacterales bacterium]